MILEKGDMWSVFGQTDLFCITTNSYVRQDGQLTMGRGIALVAKQRIPHMAAAIGREIRRTCGARGIYGLLVYATPEQNIGLFQVKRHFKDKAELAIMRYSIQRLGVFVANTSAQRVDLNFPGIGWGGLQQEDVFPLLTYLPDIVHVWEFE